MNPKVEQFEGGFDDRIVLRMLWNPPGIGSRGTVTILRASEANYGLTANGGATVGTWKIAILGEAARARQANICLLSVD